MRLPPMLASLTRHKLTVALMLLASAFTCAIVTNVAALVVHRMTLVHAPSGLDESAVVLFNSARIDASGQFSPDAPADFWPRYQADLRALRAVPGVRSATAGFGLPMDGGSGFSITASPHATSDQGLFVNAFSGGPGELRTLGLDLVSGRDFTASEYVTKASNATAAIISRALARRLFHTADAVGRLFYRQGHPIRVVGVVAHLMIMDPQLGANDNEYAMLLPVEPAGAYTQFLLNTAPGRRASVLKRAVATLAKRDPQRVFDGAKTFAQVRAKYFSRDSSMIGMLLAAGIGLLLVTAAGIAGLASFWVQQRTRSIGVRRALGARRTDILRYTHIENFLIVTAGVLLGCALAYGLNALLMEHYAVQALPPAYLVIGAIALWLVGQLAVLAPSLHAGAIPPALATRSV